MDILISFILLEIAGDFHFDIYLYCIYIIYIHTTSTFTYPFNTLGSHIRFCKVIRALTPSVKFSSSHHEKVMVLQVQIV